MIGKTEHLENLLAPTVEAMGFRIWGIERNGTGRNTKLSVYIDSENGINVDDCRAVNDQINGLLDAEEALSDIAMLEVSSPGMDRILFKREQFESSIGEIVDVRLRWPVEGSSNIRGELLEVAPADICVRHNDVPTNVALVQVRQARIVPQFS